MKKVFLIISIAVLLSNINVFGQIGPYVGAGGSVNSVWVMYPNSYGIYEYARYQGSNYKSTIGGAFFLSFNYNFFDIFGVRLEVQKSYQGQNYSYTDPDDNNYIFTKDISLNYIQIPIMLRLATEGEKVKTHIMVGPQFGFLTSASQSNLSYDPKRFLYSQEVTFLKPGDITNRFNSTDFLIVGEIGADIVLTEKLFINVGLRVNYGLTDINNSTLRKEYYSYDSKIPSYNSSYNLYGGLTFGINYLIK